MKIGIAGAGLSGAVTGRVLADAGHRVTVFERRNHLGGNCHTGRERGVMVHRYGPHIFHTGSSFIWRYVCRHADMVPFTLRVKATARNAVYSLPINLHTLNQVFGTTMNPATARRFLAMRVIARSEPTNFEEAALASVGKRLYELFFEGYTTKQWGCHPREVPASVFRRLPVRFDYNDNYFEHRYQGIPRHGYTAMIESILDHPNIEVQFDEFPHGEPEGRFDHVVWTGPLDEWFGWRHGRLNYRTLRFDTTTLNGDYQGTALMNYPDPDVPWTRITEHKHFAPWEQHDSTVITHEFSHAATDRDEPFYPTRLAADIPMLHCYLRDAAASKGVTFVGRLATYRYLDMDVTIGEALRAGTAILEPNSIPALTHQETTWQP